MVDHMRKRGGGGAGEGGGVGVSFSKTSENGVNLTNYKNLKEILIDEDYNAANDLEHKNDPTSTEENATAAHISKIKFFFIFLYFFKVFFSSYLKCK